MKKEKVKLETYKGWVKGKVYSDVRLSPLKYREFCAIVTFSNEKGEEKIYLPYSNGADVSFKVTDVKVGDILYMGYRNGYKNRTEQREYCKVIEKTDDYLIIEDGYESYLSALNDNKE